MATEQEIKLLIPSNTDLTQIIPADAKQQEVTQVYLSPDKSDIQITKQGEEVRISLTARGAMEPSVLSISGAGNMAAFQDLATSPLSIIGKEGKVSFDGKDTEIRIRTKNDKAYLTIKKKTKSAEFRNEFEFEIPAAEAIRLQDQHIADGTAKIEKTRMSWKREGSTFELDNFAGANKGLVVLEIENPPAHFDPSSVAPSVIDVTSDKKYGNRQLAEHPYSEWGVVYQDGVSGREGGRKQS